MEVVIFTKVHGHAKSQSPQTLRVLGLSDFASPWTFLQRFLFAASTFYAFLQHLIPKPEDPLKLRGLKVA